VFEIFPGRGVASLKLNPKIFQLSKSGLAKFSSHMIVAGLAAVGKKIIVLNKNIKNRTPIRKHFVFIPKTP
jgi:hypothetical protein